MNFTLEKVIQILSDSVDVKYVSKPVKFSPFQSNIHNMEYLKNVILKFITLTPGTERVGLIPVLDTMLQFDQSERNRLVEIAGQEEDAANSSWGSYLPRWGGI